MKAAAFQYLRPRSLEEAAAALVADGHSRLLAGGQSLAPLLNLRLIRPTTLIDISGLDELRRIDQTPTAWRVGAGVTHARLEDSPLAGCEILSRVAGEISYRSIRNRGTIGGALAHADPSGDWTLALAAFDARVIIRSVDGALRAVAAERFTTAPFTTVLESGDIVVAIELEKRSSRALFGYFKFCRKAGDYPEVSAAVLHDVETSRARVYIGALGTEPKSLPPLAALLERGDQAAFADETIAASIASVAPRLDEIEIGMRVAAVQRALAQVRAA